MLQGAASIILTMSDERHSSAFICQPTCQILLIVRRLIFAPIIRTIIGLSKSKINPKTKFSGRICSRRSSLPSGLQIRLSSCNPATGSGAEQKTNVAKTVSNESSAKFRCWTSISCKLTLRFNLFALLRARLSIRGLKSIAVMCTPSG